jgi:hypothetical protein
MAGDKKGEQRKYIDKYSNPALKDMQDLRTQTLVPQNQQFWNNYLSSVDQAKGDYGNIMDQYQNFAQTGGFSPTDLGNIRARAVSPLRSVYANANREVDRSKALQGGYSPGYGTLKARMAREMGQGLSDASTNAEAAIAQMVQQGKLAGMQGSSNLYGATPGMANMFGNQVLNSTQQRLAGLGQENDFRMGLIGAQQNAQALPGKWEGTMGRIKDIAGIGTSLASPWMGGIKGGGFGGGYLPNRPLPGAGDINSGMYGTPIAKAYGY